MSPNVHSSPSLASTRFSKGRVAFQAEKRLGKFDIGQKRGTHLLQFCSLRAVPARNIGKLGYWNQLRILFWGPRHLKIIYCFGSAVKQTYPLQNPYKSREINLAVLSVVSILRWAEEIA